MIYYINSRYYLTFLVFPESIDKIYEKRTRRQANGKIRIKQSFRPKKIWFDSGEQMVLPEKIEFWMRSRQGLLKEDSRAVKPRLNRVDASKTIRSVGRCGF